MIGLIATGVGIVADTVYAALPKVKEDIQKGSITAVGDLQHAGEITGSLLGLTSNITTVEKERDSVGARFAKGVSVTAKVAASMGNNLANPAQATSETMDIMKNAIEPATPSTEEEVKNSLFQGDKYWEYSGNFM